MDPATGQTIIQGGILVTTIFIAKTVSDIKKKMPGGDDPQHTDPDKLKS